MVGIEVNIQLFFFYKGRYRKLTKVSSTIVGALVKIDSPSIIPDTNTKKFPVLILKFFDDFRYTTIKIALSKNGYRIDSRYILRITQVKGIIENNKDEIMATSQLCVSLLFVKKDSI